jgi:DNA-binding MarR family transcriptional regulator
MGLAKRDLLSFLARVNEASADDVASAIGIRYAVAAMALLRLVRQGLAERSRQDERSIYFYRLSERGRARLRYFEERPQSAARGRPAATTTQQERER